MKLSRQDKKRAQEIKLITGKKFEHSPVQLSVPKKVFYTNIGNVTQGSISPGPAPSSSKTNGSQSAVTNPTPTKKADLLYTDLDDYLNQNQS